MELTAIPPDATSPTEVEPTVRNETTRCQNCKTLCGRENGLLVLLVVFVAGAHLYIYATYAGGLSRKWLWVFLLLSILSWVLALSFILRTVCVACFKQKPVENENEKSRRNRASRLPWLEVLKAKYDSVFNVNGKYYLTKMYASEAFENGLQLYNMTTIYLCWMPLVLSTVVSVVLMFELLVNMWATFHIDSQLVRDRQLLLDIFTDIFCLAFPLLYIWFEYKVPLELPKMIQLTAFPTISLLLKANDIWEDVFHVDEQRVIGTWRSHRRKSILGLSENSQVFSKQLKHFPRWLRVCFTALSGVFVLVLIALMSVHWTTQPSDAACSGVYSSEVWKGCRLKVPFCQNPVVARCDCAVVQMVNYSQAELPKSFGQMRSLIKMSVFTGELQRLPNATGMHHPDLLVLEVVSNRLVELPEDIGGLENLLRLRVDDNPLKALPDSVGALKNLLYLDVSNNQLKALPDSVGTLKNLVRLYVENNQLKALPDSVGTLKNLVGLYVQNNQLKALPDSVGTLKNLLYLYAWNNSLTSIPDGMTALEEVDVRHNDLTSLPINDWTRAKYVYAAGNPLCPYDFPAGVQGRCETQCSVDCPSAWLGDGYCDDGDYVYDLTKDINPNARPTPNSGCNTKACEYDKGDCPV